MMTSRFRHRGLALVVALFHLAFSTVAQAFDASMLPRTEDEGNVREFFASNRQKRFLLRVHVWGDVPLSGVYYVPDNSTVLDVLGFAGGPAGLLQSADVTLNRQNPKSQEVTTRTFPGTRLVWDDDLRKDLVQEGDVIFVDSPQRVDTTGRVLSIISVVAGILAAGAAVYGATRPR